MEVRTIDGVGRLADAYDGFILDLWGVLYDGGTVFPHARDTMARLRAGGARLVILSNGPRRAAAVAARIAAAGIPEDSYDGVMSSGEEAWQLLRDPGEDAWYRALGRRVFFLGPDSDRPMLDGLDLAEVDSAAEADFILDLGPLDPGHSIADYEPMLAAAIARQVPMICANPDLVVHRLGRVEICAGTMAERYAELGGFVRWHGKPHPSVYGSSLALMPGIDRRRILAVGDSFRTDIRGANGAGLDSLLVTHGIHRDDLCDTTGVPDAARIRHEATLAGAMPTFACGAFTW
ncbi:MAG: TIGR01459 family HAD-type hydrolase [Rhodospirillales bacterium]|nr:MAG: TIGR01459 family HAD-type hydrolase [Rhodospirillales bacterium]